MATSREFGKSPKSFYKPGFIDTVNPEMMKMSVDRELGEISKSLYQVDENVATKNNSKYKGKWNPVSGKYPDHGYENSYWDVETIDDKPFDFDNQTWVSFQTLIYDKGLNQFFQVNDWASGEMKERIERLQVSTGTSTAAIQTLTRVMSDADSALAERITTLATNVSDGDTRLTARINDLDRTFTDTNTATATSIKTLTSQIKDVDTKIGVETGKLNDATKLELANLSTSLGADVKSVDAKVSNVSSELSKTSKTLTDLISSTAVDKVALNSRLDGVDAKITTSANTLSGKIDAGDKAIGDKLTTISDDLGARVTSVSVKADKIASDLSVTNTTIADLTRTVATNQTNLSSSLTNVDSRITTVDGALKNSIGVVDKNAKDGLNQVNIKADKIASDLVITNKTVATLTSTTASQVTTLTSSVDNLRTTTTGGIADAKNAATAAQIAATGAQGAATAAQGTANNAVAATVTLQQQMTTTANRLGQVEGKWSITIDANNKVSGVQLLNGTGGSDFSVRADRFSFSDTSGNKSYGFTSTGGVTTFTGSIAVADHGGNVGMKITNSQILVYDEQGRLRVKIGRLS